MTNLKLLVHILLDLVHWHMARTFYHNLNIMLPGKRRQLSQRLQLGELGFVIGIGDRAGTQAIPSEKATSYVFMISHMSSKCVYRKFSC